MREAAVGAGHCCCCVLSKAAIATFCERIVHRIGFPQFRFPIWRRSSKSFKQTVQGTATTNWSVRESAGVRISCSTAGLRIGPRYWLKAVAFLFPSFTSLITTPLFIMAHLYDKQKKWKQDYHSRLAQRAALLAQEDLKGVLCHACRLSITNSTWLFFILGYPCAECTFHPQTNKGRMLVPNYPPPPAIEEHVSRITKGREMKRTTDELLE